MENKKVLIIEEGGLMDKKELGAKDFFISSGSDLGLRKGIEGIEFWIHAKLEQEFDERFEKDPEFAEEVMKIVKEQKKKIN